MTDPLRHQMAKTESISDERLAEFVDNPSHYSSEIFKMASELQFRRAANSDGGVEPGWHEGEPPKHLREEWFIAALVGGGRGVLRSLPEEWTYDYTTQDHTYYKADRIKKWMQFPDSDFIPYVPPAKALDGIAVTDDVYDLRKAAEFLLWQYDRQGPLAESTEAWEQLRSALK